MLHHSGNSSENPLSKNFANQLVLPRGVEIKIAFELSLSSVGRRDTLNASSPSVSAEIMSGLDALSAVALGAKAVFIGRAYLYGAMANGEVGVQQVIDLMRREFINGMSLSGARTIKEVQENGARIRSSFHE